MNETITMQNHSQYQIIQGTPRRVYGAKQTLLRESHALAVRATDGETAKSRPLCLWATDLRRGRLNVYGSLLRVIDLLHAKGYPVETALLLSGWLDAYIRDVWSDDPKAPAARLAPARGRRAA